MISLTLSRLNRVHPLFAMATSLRQEVLGLYKKCLRLSRVWEAKNPADTEKERKYILDEARTLFRANKNLVSEEEIRKCLKEGYTRYEIASHYRIPYPRPIHYPTGYVAKLQKKKIKDK